MPGSTGIATFVSGSIDNALQTFVTSTSSAIITGITPLVAIGMSIWCITYGFAVMRNEVGDPISTFVKNLLKISMILGVALSAGFYQIEVVDGVLAFQNGFVNAVTPNASGNIYGVLDKFDESSSELGLVIIGHGMTLMPLGGYLDIIAGLIVLCCSSILMVIAIGFLVTAKVAIAFMLGIGPAFIASLAFPPIAKFFEAWLGKILNYTFLIIGLGIGVAMAVAIAKAYVDSFANNQGATQNISDAFGLIIVEGALLIVIWQMPSMASGLGGGAALNGGGVGAFIGGMIVNKLLGGSGNDDKKDDKDGGGEIKDQSRSGGGGSKGGGAGNAGNNPATPAYRRATLQQLEHTKHKDL